MTKELVLIKLGGSLITDKKIAFKARREVIKRLAKEIKESLRKHKGDLIVGHGSGSFGHTVANKYSTQEGIINKKSLEGFPLVSNAAKKINSIVMDILLEEGLKAVSFSPLSYTYTKDQEKKNIFLEPITKAIKIGLIPVIYGDVIMDEKRGFCIYSGEKSLNILANYFKNDYSKLRIIYCGETDGVYDLKGKNIPKIDSSNYSLIESALGASSGVDVTGGMIHKVKESMQIAKELKVNTLIINGKNAGSLKNAILNKESQGTIISF